MRLTLRPCIRLLILAACLSSPVRAQQGITAQPHTRREQEPPSAPAVVARPDFAVHDGGVSVVTFGKIVAARTFDLPANVRSMFEATVSLDAPGERAIEPAIRKGLVRVSLQNLNGLHGQIGLWGDPKSQTLHASVASALPGSIQLNASVMSLWMHQPWGDERIGHGRVGVVRNAPAGFVVEPAVHVVNVDAQSDLRWFGASCRVEGRGMQAHVSHDFGRRRVWMLRKNWRRSNVRATLGTQILERAGARDRGLIEIGAAAGGFAVHWFPAHDQQAVLLGIGPVQVGYGRRAAHRQLVLGVGSLSLSCFESVDGPVFGLGFVYDHAARHVSRAPAGWRWDPAQHVASLQEPQMRWPGFATHLD